MSKTAVVQLIEPQETERDWSVDVPAVRAALKWLKQRGHATTEEVVAWDLQHGRRLFTWDNEKAGALRRLDEARLFLNRFRAQFEDMRVRAFIHIREDEQHGIEKDEYFTVETISQHPGMRAQVIADIIKRMANLAGELKMWKLTADERRKLFARLEAVMNGENKVAA